MSAAKEKNKSLDPVKNQFLETDQQGNYDIDGVSYAGEDVVVSGDESRPHAGTHEFDSFRKRKQRTKTYDRKQNLDHET